jgi:hypothetical protein
MRHGTHQIWAKKYEISTLQTCPRERGTPCTISGLQLAFLVLRQLVVAAPAAA